MHKSAKLIDDEAYITAAENLSRAPGNYMMAFPPTLKPNVIGTKCAPFIGGCKQKHVVADVIDQSNSMYVPVNTRPNEKPWTEIYSIPFKARGEGLLNHPDTLSKLQTSGFTQKCSSTLSEVNYDRFQCINAPLAVENEKEFGARGGAHTRVGPRYDVC
jgi:hypothetical protein